MENKQKRELDIAIIGGGFTGVYCGKALRKTLARNPSLRAGLISGENYMVFQPMLPEVASASISPRHVVNPIRHLCKELYVYKAGVEKIDLGSRELTIRPGPFSPDIVVKFRHLVLALGAEVDLSRVPGMSEHAFLMQNVGDAMKLRATVLARFEEANLVTEDHRRRRLLTFVVVGGGYSGVETAGQILDLFQGINQFYRHVGPEDFHVVLVHSQQHLLPTLSHTLGDYAEDKLRKRGLDIRLQRRVKAVTANQVVLDNGEMIESNTVVSTVGNAPHPLISGLIQQYGLESDGGRIRTAGTLEVPGYDFLWAGGDCASVPLPDGGTCPANAQFAMRQGTLLGHNLGARIREATPRSFTFTGLGELASIGHRTAVAEILGLRFSGFFAWWLWRTIYLGKLPGLDRKLRVVIDWTLDLFFPRDINLLSPRYSQILQEAYLEPGDILFNAGEPAFSFYIVKKGRIELLDSDGKIIKTVPAGEFFGERALLSDKTWHFTARAHEETSLIALGGAEFKTLLESSATMRNLLEHSARQYRSSREIDSMLDTLPPDLLREPAESLMSTGLIQLRPGDTMENVLRQLGRERHSYYPVIDPETERPLGVLAREEFYNHLQFHGLDTGETISRIPLSELPAVSPGLPVKECLETMVRGGSNKLLVCDENHSLVGILSLRDIVTASVTQK